MCPKQQHNYHGNFQSVTNENQALGVIYIHIEMIGLATWHSYLFYKQKVMALDYWCHIQHQKYLARGNRNTEQCKEEVETNVRNA